MSATPVRVFESPEQLGHDLAARIADGITAARAEGRRYLLGCPGGRTARPVYDSLAALVSQRGLPLDNLVVVMMDDYVDLADGAPRRVSPDAHYSCQRFGLVEILGIINVGASSPVPETQLWLPDPARPEAYDEQIAAAGDIDLFLLASGESDGHVAFNGPGSPVESRTRLVELAPETRGDNMRTFPAFERLEDVPTHGVTVGIDTLCRRARELVMILVADHKQEAFGRIASVDHYDPDWPATVVHLGAERSIVADRAAAAGRARPHLDRME